MVKEVNCQFTFGVFTKWDEFIKKAKNDDNVDVEFLRKEYEERYLQSVDNKGEVYFVSVGCVENNNVSLSFILHSVTTIYDCLVYNTSF